MGPTTRRLWPLALACGVAVPASAQRAHTLAAASWTSTQGLPTGIVRGIAQDRDGYLWIATQGALARFDGSVFRPVPVPDSREARRDFIRQLAVDATGAVRVVRFESGIGRIMADGSIGSTTDTPPRPPERLAFAGGDTLWMAGDGELWRRTGGRWREFPTLRDTIGTVLALVPDGRAGVWIGGRRGVLHVAANGTARAWRGPGAPRPLLVAALAADGRGGAWLATARGLLHATPERGPTPVAGDAALRDTVQDVAMDADGRLRVASGDGIRVVGVSLGPAGPRARVMATWRTDFTGAHVTASYVDRDGALWVGTEAGALHRLRTLPVQRVRRVDGLAAREAHQLLDDGDGGLWVAGGCRGLVRRARDGRVTRHGLGAVGLRELCVHSLARDTDGGLLIGQRGGLTLDATGPAPRWLDLTALTANDVGPLHRARDGRLWIALRDGPLLHLGRDDSVRAGVFRGPWLPNRVWSLAEDAHGVHVGQFGALLTVVGDSVVRQLDPTDGLPRATVRGIATDADGALWLATYGGGLAHVARDGRVRVLGTAQGLHDDALSAVVRDDADRLWLLGDRGVAAAPRRDFVRALDEGRAPASLAVLGMVDSVAEGNGGFPNAQLARDGRLHVATTDGVASIDTRAFPFGQRVPVARIDAVRLDGTVVAARGTITIPPGNHALEVEFSAAALDLPDGARFRYRLAGHDRDWVEAGTARVARWSELRPGRYVLEVLGTRAAGAAGGPVASLAVAVRAAWWETWWARALAAVAILGVVAEVARRAVARANARTERLRREILERERAQAEADRTTRELHHAGRLATAGVLAASVAHEINQPLAAVMANASAARTLLGRGDVREVGPALDDIPRRPRAPPT
jgi:ligand-binding sensor domain-containing protein